MAHFKRKYPRTIATGNYSANGIRHRFGYHDPDSRQFDRQDYLWVSRYPRYWDKLHHTRPARAESRRLVQAILHGADPDNLTWPDGRKPHIYYW